jgi:outer membrane protein assembly factor BamE (lipoprotein component of BamABCDE complex)
LIFDSVFLFHMMRRFFRKAPSFLTFKLFTLTTLNFFFAGCEVVKTQQGHLSAVCDIESFRNKIGTAHKDEVLTALGPPTMVMPYDPNTWYYGSGSVETQGFLTPQLTCTLTHVLTFNDCGSLTHFSKRSGPLKVTLSEKRTPLPSAHRTGLWERVFHNLGRYPSQSTNNQS